MSEEARSLPEALRDWTDVDVTLFELGRALGVIGPSVSFNQAKGVVWWGDDNPLAHALYDTLRTLVGVGIIEEKPGDAEVFRWSPMQPSPWAD